MSSVKKIKNLTEWEEVKQSSEEELILFKYSPFCGVSFSVERTFDKWLSSIKNGDSVKCVKVNVITSKSLSRQISNDFGIKHESPQLIWFEKSGTVKWHASHHSINEQSLNSQLN